MQAMECRAAGIAAGDLQGGIALLKKIRDEQTLNLLSMNLVDMQTTHPIFAPFMQIRVGNTKITILGLTDEQAGRADDPKYTILPWQDTLPDILAKIEKNTDMIILLSSYPEKTNKKIARTMATIDLILASGHSNSNLPPQQVDNTLLARVGARGKYLGMMRIHWTHSGHWGKNVPDKIRNEQNQLDRITWLINRLKRQQQNNLPENKQYQDLLTARKQSEQKIAALKKDNAQETGQPCSYTNHFYALRSSLPQDNTIQAIIDQTSRKINELNRKHLRSSSKTL